MLFLILWLGSFAAGVGATSNHVVMISIDGLRPEFYLPGAASTNCPTLVSLRENGSHARRMLPVYPSHTYPGHATLATGVRPARHEIISNTIVRPQYSSPRGFWYASDLKAPALWDAARRAGVTVATVSWPCTAGSKTIDWDVPEFWTTPLGKEVNQVRRYATPGLIERIEAFAGPMNSKRHSDPAAWDSFLAGCAAYLVREHKPNLLLLHLGEADKLQHRTGPSAPELPAAMRRLDAHVDRLLRAVQDSGLSERTTFLIVGDHGFAEVSKSIALNAILAQQGIVRVEGRTVKEWKAWFENTGGSAGVYLKDPKDDATAKSVRALAEKHAVLESGKRLYRIVEKAEVEKRGGPKNALFCLEAESGYMFSASVSGSNLVRRATLKGNHGWFPETRGMETGFIAVGRGIRKEATLDTIEMVDVAPTVAALLGFALEGVEGRLLKEFLE